MPDMSVVVAAWNQAMSANVQTVPLSEPLFQEAARHAEQLGVSTQEWIQIAVQERIRHEEDEAAWNARAARASGRSLAEILGNGPDNPPNPGDELPEGWTAS